MKEFPQLLFRLGRGSCRSAVSCITQGLIKARETQLNVCHPPPPFLLPTRASCLNVVCCGRSGLSEGEWQRLQLARFLMRADVAKLLLLDEPFKGVSPAEASRMLAALGAQARATGQVPTGVPA